MSFRHNKKRNVGLLQEFFSRYIATAILEKRMSDVDKAKTLIAKFFTPTSELGREIAMFNALMETRVENKEIALSLLERVKASAKRQNQKKLDEEKSRLIDSIKNVLKDPNFFDRPINEYKDFATVQILLNACRGIGFKGSLKELCELEDGILKKMVLTESSKTGTKPSADLEVLEMTDNDIDGLVFKLMSEKANQKFSGVLNEEQQQLVKLYALSSKNDLGSLKQKLSSIKEECKTLLSEALDSTAYDRAVKIKLEEAKRKMENEFSSFEKVDDSTITFYMTLLKLKEELQTK